MKSDILSKKPTPIPFVKVFIISMILFANIFGLMIIFPILPFITHDFFPNLDKSELGYKQGYLGSAFQFGKLFGVLFWGRLSDIYGRRPTMLCGLMGSIASMLMFGFSPSFFWACTSRFLWGLLNGNFAIATTYLTEILDDTNQAKGFTSIGISSALARMAAPVIGGFLSQPASKYPSLNIALFRKFPYLLPCLFGVTVGIISLIGAYKYLTETLEKPEKAKERLLESSIETNENDVKGKLLRPGFIKRIYQQLLLIILLFLQRNTLLSILMYGVIAFITILSQEVVPLIMVTDYVNGGYCMDGNEVGLLFIAGSFFFLFNHLFLFSRVIKWFSYRRTIRIYFVVHLVSILMLPYSSAITGPVPISSTSSSSENMMECHFSDEKGKEALNVNSITRIPFHFWLLMFIIMSLLIASRSTLLNATLILVSNSSEPHVRGTVNAMGQFVASFMRVLAPAFGTLVFAWSQSNGMAYPFNHHFIFLALGVLIAITFLMSFGLSREIETKKKSTNDTAFRHK